MNIKSDKCISCGGHPTIMTIGDVVYAQCSCGKWNPYQFCGARTEHAVRQWNEANCNCDKYVKGK